MINLKKAIRTTFYETQVLNFAHNYNEFEDHHFDDLLDTVLESINDKGKEKINIAYTHLYDYSKNNMDSEWWAEVYDCSKEDFIRYSFQFFIKEMARKMLDAYEQD